MIGPLGAAGGGLLGGALGQVSDALSAPRRALWGAVGLPDSGAEALAKYAGMDPNSLLTQLLGGGAEMLGDPLTYAGLLAGGPLAKMGAAPWLKEAQLAGTAGDLRAGIGGADAALASRSALEAQTLQREIEAAQGLGKYDVPGIAAGETKAFARTASPDVIDALSDRGLGYGLPSNAPMDPNGPAMAFGRETPFGFDTPPLRGQQGGRMIGRGLAFDTGTPLEPLPRPMTPQDRDFLQSFGGRTLGAPGQMSDLETQAALEALGRHVGGGVNAARPMPTLGEAATQNPLLDQLIGRRGGTLPMHLPLTDAREQMAQTLAGVQGQLGRYKMNPADWGMVGGAGLVGLGLGGSLGGR